MNSISNFFKFFRCWTIAISCSLINMILDGTVRCGGLFFVAVQETFTVNRRWASVPFATCVAVRNLSGVLVGILATRYGPGSVTLVGAVLSAIGIGLCFVAPTIVCLTVSFGFIFGVGYGMGNILLPIIIGNNFKDSSLLASATGFALCGSCFGSLVLPVVFTSLIAYYGLRGTLLFVAGLTLNCVPLSMILIHFTSPDKTQELLNFSRKRSKSETDVGNRHDGDGNQRWRNGKQPQRKSFPRIFSKPPPKPLRTVSVDVSCTSSTNYERGAVASSNSSSSHSLGLRSGSLASSSASCSATTQRPDGSECRSDSATLTDNSNGFEPNNHIISGSSTKTAQQLLPNGEIRPESALGTASFEKSKNNSKTDKDFANSENNKSDCEPSENNCAVYVNEVILSADDQTKISEIGIVGSDFHCAALNTSQNSRESRNQMKLEEKETLRTFQLISKISDASDLKFRNIANTKNECERNEPNITSNINDVHIPQIMMQSNGNNESNFVQERPKTELNEVSQSNNSISTSEKVDEISGETTRIANQFPESTSLNKQDKILKNSICSSESISMGVELTKLPSEIKEITRKVDVSSRSRSKMTDLIITNKVLKDNSEYVVDNKTLNPKSIVNIVSEISRETKGLQRQSSCPSPNVQTKSINGLREPRILPKLKVTVLEYTVEEHSYFQERKNKKHNHYRRHANSVSHKFFENDLEAIGNAAKWAFHGNNETVLTNSSTKSPSTEIIISEDVTRKLDKTMVGDSNSTLPNNDVPLPVLPTKNSPFAVFTNISFVTVILLMTCYEFIFVGTMTVIADYSRDIGETEDLAKWLLVTISVGNVFSRLCLGWITDSGLVKKNVFASVCFAGITFSIFGLSLATDSRMLLASCAGFGVFESGVIVMFPLLLRESIDEKQLTMAQSASNCGPGIICLIIPFVIGIFRDSRGSYRGLFYVMILSASISSASCLLLPILNRMKRCQK